MLNLVRFREKAAYPDGRDATGAEAYAVYGRDSLSIICRLGGRIIWRASFELMLIAEYPSVGAFVEMIRDPIY